MSKVIGVLTGTRLEFFEDGRKAGIEQSNAQLNKMAQQLAEEKQQLIKLQRISVKMMLEAGETPQTISEKLEIPLSEVLEFQKEL